MHGSVSGLTVGYVEIDDSKERLGGYYGDEGAQEITSL
jgi:hypothetical protein